MAAISSSKLKTKRQAPTFYDRWLLFTVFSLFVIGLVMVASASIVVAEKQFNQPFYFLTRQLIFLMIGFVAAFVVIRFELDLWRKYSGWLLILSYILLILVLVPGIGRVINGSMRWLGVGLFGIQVSELAKFFCIIYLAGYLVRKQEEVQTRVIGFIKPMVLIGLIALLLLKEPDFGAATVIITTALGMMFLAGVRLWQFAILLGSAVFSLAVLAISSPYRMARLTSFLNPWADQYDSGYQLTQSLIAFGRGGWTGMGLGASIQKLFYLPEAHTDFLFAVLAEELGLLGVFAVLALFALFIARIFILAKRAWQQQRPFAAFIAFGFGLWLAFQSMINIGVNTGILPTKGLTLPMMSYGGSSMIVMCLVIALLFRIDYETRLVALREYRSK
ncbi:MAG: putative lipid II flippase FtsW [Gammaproteobacteria bacterium]